MSTSLNLGDLLWWGRFALAVIDWFKELGPTAPAASKQLPLPAPHLPVQRHKVIVSTVPGTFDRSTGTWVGAPEQRHRPGK